MTRIFVLPFAIKGNPHMGLLYRAVESSGEYKAEAFSFGKVFLALARGERVIVHIHWESNVYGSRFLLLSLVRIAYRFPLLFLARLLGAKIAWTMHNLSSRDYPHPAIDRLGRRLMWLLVQGVMIQNKTVAAQMALAHPRATIAHVPLATFKVYGPPRPEARGEMRRAFGVGEDEILLLSLGSIRAYKQPEILIDALRGVRGVRLLIAGTCDPAYAASLRERAAGLPVIVKDAFIPDDQIPSYLAAADYCLFAYDDSTMTSAVVILALAYGVPAIMCGMALPAAELLREGNGYAVDSTKDLPEFLRTLPALPRMSPEAVEASVADLTWERTGREVRALYKAL